MERDLIQRQPHNSSNHWVIPAEAGISVSGSQEGLPTFPEARGNRRAMAGLYQLCRPSIFSTVIFDQSRSSTVLRLTAKLRLVGMTPGSPLGVPSAL